MVSPGSTPITFKFYIIMKIELGIKTASFVAAASGCPQVWEIECGIAYRA